MKRRRMISLSTCARLRAMIHCCLDVLKQARPHHSPLQAPISNFIYSNRIFFCCYAFLALFVASVDASAGAVPGPYVAWVNLSKHPGVADKMIEDCLESGDDSAGIEGH